MEKLSAINKLHKYLSILIAIRQQEIVACLMTDGFARCFRIFKTKLP